jgi:DnaJ-class molecular chaperone
VQIAAAYEVLADDEKRKLYDQVNDAAVQASSVLGVCIDICELSVQTC